MKSVRELSERYERERRESSERHRRKLEQMSRRRERMRLDREPNDAEPAEQGD